GLVETILPDKANVGHAVGVWRHLGLVGVDIKFKMRLGLRRADEVDEILAASQMQIAQFDEIPTVRLDRPVLNDRIAVAAFAHPRVIVYLLRNALVIENPQMRIEIRSDP